MTIEWALVEFHWGPDGPFSRIRPFATCEEAALADMKTLRTAYGPPNQLGVNGDLYGYGICGCQVLPLDDALRLYPDAGMIVEWGTDGENGSCTNHGGLVG